MPRVWVVRADGGKSLDEFTSGPHPHISFGFNIREDITHLTDVDQIEEKCRSHNPDRLPLAGRIARQIHAFLFDIKPRNVVLTPTTDRKWLRYGTVQDGSPYYREVHYEDGGFHGHHRPVEWRQELLYRYDCSDEDQIRMRQRPTVVLISDDAESFWSHVASGSGTPAPTPKSGPIDPEILGALEKLIDEVNWVQAQDLIADLLSAMGCEVLCVSPPGPDGGVDIWAVSSVMLTPDVPLFVQVKRYKWGNNINAKAVRELRGGIKFGGRGVFVTTSTFAKGAREVATEPEYPYIALIDGPKLIALLREHWDKMSPDFRQRLDFLNSTAS